MKYISLKWSLRGILIVTLLVSVMAAVAQIATQNTQEAILNYCFLTACAINAEQIAQCNTCRLNVTLASNLYLIYQTQTNKSPFQERERGITAPEMFAALSLFAKEQLFENLDHESTNVIVDAPSTIEVAHVPLTCYLLAAYKVACDQEKEGIISENLTTFLQTITDKKQNRTIDNRDILLTLDIKSKEYLHNLLDIHSRQRIELYLKQRCGAAAKLVDHRNNLPL